MKLFRKVQNNKNISHLKYLSDRNYLFLLESQTENALLVIVRDQTLFS